MPDISPINDTPDTSAPTQTPTATPVAPVAPVASPAQTPTTPTATTPPAAQPTSTPAAPQPSQQTQPQPQNQVSNTIPNQQKPQGQPQGQAPVAPPPHPLVQKASLLRQVAEQLVPPTYSYSVQADGSMAKVKNPQSPRSIGLALALTALSGAAAAGIKKSDIGEAGARGLAAGQQIAQERTAADQQARAEAQSNFSNQYEALKGNMMIQSMSLALRKQTRDEQQGMVDSTAGALKEIQDNTPDAIVADHVDSATAQDIKKYPPTQYRRIADSVIPAQDADGNPVYVDEHGHTSSTQTPGSYQGTQPTYSIVDISKAQLPTQNADGTPSEWVQSGVKWGLIPKSFLSASGNMPAARGLNLASEAHALDFMQGQLQNYADYYNQHLPQGAKPVDVSGFVKDAQSPLTRNAVYQFQASLAHNNGDIQKTVASMDGKNAQVVTQLFGGTDAIAAYQTAKDNDKQAALKSITGVANSEEAQANVARLTAKQQTGTLSSDETQLLNASNYYLKNNIKYQANLAGAKAGAEERAKVAAQNATGNGQSYNVNTGTGLNTSFLSSLPAGRQSELKAIHDGRVEINSRTFSGKQGEALLKDITTYDPSFDQTKAPAYAKLRNSFVAGKDADVIRAGNTMIHHLGRMYDNSYWGSTLPVVSALERAGGKQTAVDFKTSKATVEAEIDKFYTGRETDATAKQTRELLNAMTPYNAKANVKSILGLMDGQLDSIHGKWDNGVPSANVTPVEILHPDTYNTFKRITGTEPSVKPVSGTSTSNEQPVYVSGALVGYTIDGKSISRKAQ